MYIRCSIVYVLSVFKMMSRQLLKFLVIIGLAKQAFADCRDLTLDACEEKPAFETYKDLGDETICQAFCRDIFPGDCMFFIYDRMEDLCKLFSYNPEGYASSCRIMAGTPLPKLEDCQESTDECLVSMKKQ